MNYRGTLVHVKNNEVIMLKVSHLIENGHEVERVAGLNEDGSEYSRKVTDYSLSKLPTFNKEMQAVYSFDLGSVKKVATRECQVVIARPKDRMRYLQKYCVDLKTSLLLDYTIIDKSHKPIEQFKFTDLEVLSENKDANNTPEASDTVKMAAKKALPMANTSKSAWSLKATPKGFSLRKAPMMRKKAGEADTEHYVLSDGLSSVSIFISKKFKNAKESGEKSGALNVVTQYKGEFAVTLVGEVPESTLKEIFGNLEYSSFK